MYNFHIANSAMCILGVGNGPSDDVSVTVSTKFFREKKMVRIKIRYLALKNSLFLVSRRNDNISRGCAKKKMEFPEGRGVHFVRPIFGKSRGEGGHR